MSAIEGSDASVYQRIESRRMRLCMKGTNVSENFRFGTDYEICINIYYGIIGQITKNIIIKLSKKIFEVSQMKTWWCSCL